MSCILWEGAKVSNGYGVRKIKGRMLRVHRHAWALVHGEIPKGMQVLHRCDVRNCYNVEHLFLGTGADNMADKVTKGRQSFGENHPVAKLTQEQVDQIRKAHGSQRAIARRFNVTQPTVWKILRGLSWTKS